MGSYTIIGRIGEGGMGAVYLGRGPDGRQVAIKVVRPELAQDAGFVARFREEVASAERVASFCTAQVLDHGEDAGRAYMVTEFIDGVSLKDYVKEHGELSPGMLQGVAVGVAAALVAIHSAGLIHRDLKPANVMLSFSGPRVIDFGIARALDVASGLTMTGQLVGSPGWMAPERILQQQVTTAVDIFSWGCLVAFARNGINPFGTGDFSVMSARLVHADPQVGDLPSPLDRLVRAALDKDPRNRPTARDLLLTMVGGESSEAAVLSTMTAWQSPVPLLPQGQTRVLGDEQQGRPETPRGLSGPPQGNGMPVAYGAQPTALDQGPGSRGAYDQRTSTRPGGHPATVAAGSPMESPTLPSGPGARPPSGPPPAPSGPQRESRGRGRVLLAGAAAVVVVAAAVTGWFVLKSGDGDKPSSKGSAAGPAPLPSDPLVVRIDRKPGWPSQCYGSIGTLVPTTTVAKTVFDDADKCDILPRWSPDRKSIAFTRATAAANELWVGNADGSGTRMITNQMSGRSRVAWSPDGKRIAFLAKVGTGRQIDVVTLSNPSALLQLTNDNSGKDDPAWCGSRVGFWSDRTGTQQIYTVDANKAGGPAIQVTKADHDVNDPSFSPDCKQMAYTDQPAKTDRHLWITAANGLGTPRQLTSDATRDMDATWSPNGAWIAFARGATEKPSIWAIRTNGKDEQQISPKNQFMAHPDWS
ncbi:protein kinase [Actinomadura sp. DC4]|uniref:protein kinase domain-containing protein n=1 Tax=Actinomadura sp. DC4 TaxID=3055069 RepID=UPI0025B0917F|nr:protein kinase [Actinomadura sp. DC4]MDN3359663.1 protein kinase [Actinomadura sp. DC4]